MEKDKTKIKLIFNLYKDKAIKKSMDFKSEINQKYKLSVKEISDIYVRIVNYQIKKYGGRKESGKVIEKLTKEECRKRADSVRQTKYYRLKKGGK